MTTHRAPPPAQLRVRVGATSVDLVSGLLWSLATTGIEERLDGHDDHRVLLIAGFTGRSAAERAAAGLAAAIAHAPGTSTGAESSADSSPKSNAEGSADSSAVVDSIEVVDVVDDAWLDAWREHARVERAGPFAVVPPWLDPPAGERGLVVLSIDPGRTFGSGSHASTRLVLAEVARLVQEADRVLDVGCGSGVLAIAAARCGATGVVAVDVDPGAVAATTRNAEANAVADVVRASTTPLERVAGQFDVVLANLLAPEIVRMADALTARVAEGGALVVSGLLADRWRATTARLPAWAVERELVEDGWAAITLRR